MEYATRGYIDQMILVQVGLESICRKLSKSLYLLFLLANKVINPSSNFQFRKAEIKTGNL